MSEENRNQLPSPGWDPVTVGYWEAAGAGKLVVQRCTSCGVHRAPPAWACYSCQATEWEWDELPGTGRVFTYTWADQRAAMDSPIYNISVIELDGTQGEPVRLMTQVIGVDKETLTVDLPVEVSFQPFDEEIAVPFFKPVAT
jgi:uncharacterized OB-fold protein